MGAATEMSRLDSLPTEKLTELLNMEGVPSVTSSSNGKVLTVVSGKWKASDPQGGGGLSVSATFANDYITLNKTFKEINDVLDVGGSVVIKYPDGQGVTTNYAVIGSIADESSEGSSSYTVVVLNVGGGGTLAFNATAKTDYPSVYMGD